MRQRITFFHNPEDAFDIRQLQITPEKLIVKELRAAREDRITFNHKNLPSKLVELLGSCNDLHIRWVSQQLYPSRPPLSSRLSPGLHIFFTPTNTTIQDSLSLALIDLLSEDPACGLHQSCFISQNIQETRFSYSTAFQYYRILPNLAPLIEQLKSQGWLCPSSAPQCAARLQSLSSASYVDIDYQAISQDLTLTGFWSESTQPKGWTEEIIRSNEGEKIEVGILATEQATEPEEISLGGFLTVIGDDSTASPTLFSFPARHHQQPDSTLQSYSVGFEYPTGLHPNMRISLPATLSSPPGGHCALHAYLTLPSHLFIDKYQVTDPLFLSSKNIKTVRSVYGETDLEAPDWVTMKWGSNVLIEALVPTEPTQGPWNVEIPLHLRYLAPEAGVHGLIEADVPWPVVFWACTAEEGTKMSVNPFDRTHMGYDGLFGPRTLFYHLQPAAGIQNQSLVETLQVPVMALEKAGWVEGGTVVVIISGFLWIAYVLLTSMLRVQRVSKEAKAKKQK